MECDTVNLKGSKRCLVIVTFVGSNLILLKVHQNMYQFQSKHMAIYMYITYRF